MSLCFNIDESIFDDPTAIILIGPPGSGKSTFAEQLLDIYPEKLVLISPDAIRKELNTEHGHKEVEVFRLVYDRLQSYLDEGKSVVYDATNCNKKHRVKIVNVASRHATNVIGLISRTDFLSCISYNDARDRPVPTDVITQMYLNLRNNPPSMGEGYDILAYFDLKNRDD